jgi:four helix bundle suffix protein
VRRNQSNGAPLSRLLVVKKETVVGINPSVKARVATFRKYPARRSNYDDEMTRRTIKTDGFIPAHGGYEDLLSFQKARIVYDGTVYFCGKFIEHRSRTHDQMVQAARSGKQNILEGSQASGTSKETELKLMSVARASMEELLEDYRDFLRTGGHELWDKNSKEAQFVRKLGRKDYGSYETYRSYLETRPAHICANILIHQTNYLLDQLIRQLEQAFLVEGGLRERMFRARTEARQKKNIGPIRPLCPIRRRKP